MEFFIKRICAKSDWVFRDYKCVLRFWIFVHRCYWLPVKIPLIRQKLQSVVEQVNELEMRIDIYLQNIIDGGLTLKALIDLGQKWKYSEDAQKWKISN